MVLRGVKIIILAVFLTAGCQPKAPPQVTASPPPAMAEAGDEIFGNGEFTSGPGNYLASIYAERHGSPSNAGDFLLGTLKSDPENIDLLNRAYLLMIEDGREDEAIMLAKRILRQNPQATLPILTLVIRDVKEGGFRAAENRLAAIPDQGFNKFLKLLILSWVLVGEERIDEAITTLAPLSESSGFSVLRDLHSGLIYDVSGRLTEAEAGYDKALESGNPMSFRLVELFGSFYERVGRVDRAKELYDGYLRENPDLILIGPTMMRLERNEPPEIIVGTVLEGMSEALFNISSALHQEGATRMGLIYTRMALALRPDFPIALALIAEIFDMQGRREEAIEIYEAIPADSPYRGLVDLRIALNLEALGRTGEAIARLEQLAKDNSERFDVLISLGDIWRGKEDFIKAVKAYDRAIERIGKLEKQHWALLYARGIALERSGEWPQAETDFLRALELSADQHYVLNYLGYSWVDKGINLDKAKKMIWRAVELRPTDGYIIDSQGWVLYRLGDYAGAVKSLEKAIELKPQDPTINDHLGDAYWRIGRMFEARFQWKRALALDPEPKEAEKIKNKIEFGLPETDSKSPADGRSS